MASSTNQVVSVKVGAVLAASFGQAFDAAEKKITALGKAADRSNAKFETFSKTVTRLGDALKRLNQVSQTTEQRVGTIATALNTQAASSSAAARAAASLARGYERAARAREQWNRAMSQNPPPLPASASQVPPPFPRQPRQRNGATGNPGSTGATGGNRRNGNGSGPPPLPGPGQPPPLPGQRRRNNPGNINLPTPGQVLGRAVTGLGAGALMSSTFRTVSDAMQNNAALEGEIQAVLNTAGIDDPGQLNATRKRLMGMTGSNRTNQSSTDLLGGLGVFASAGGIKFEDQLAATEIAGRVATASRSNVTDISKTGVALMQNLKLPIDQLSDALGMMTVAGQEGSFELKDMSQHFPSIGAMAAQLGMTGKEGVASLAAAMQAVRRNTGTSGEAATNMENLLSKITSNETIERFGKQGIDLKGKVQEVLASGGKMNMLEEFVKLVQDSTGGDALAIKALIPDMQANAALTALLQHKDYYTEVRDKTAQGSSKDVDKNYSKNAATTEAQLKSISNSVERIRSSFGKAFESILPVVAPILDKVAGIFETITDAAPGAVVAVTGITAALGGVVSAVALFGEGGILAGVGPAFMSVFGAIGTAIAGVTAPVWAIGAAIVAAGVLVYKYWEPIKAWFIGFGQGVMEATAPIWEAFGEALVALQPVWEAFKEVLGELLEPLGLTSAEFGNVVSMGKTAGKVVGAMITAWLKPLQWVLEAVAKLSDWMSGSGDVRGKRQGKNSETEATYNTARDGLMKKGVWSDDFGRDTVDMGKLTKMVMSGEISAKEMQAIADAQNMEGVGRGSTLGDDYVGSVHQLAKVAAKREAEAAERAKTEQTNNVNITVNAPNATPDTAKKLDSTMQDVSKRLTSDLRDQTRGTHQDNTSPGVQ